MTDPRPYLFGRSLAELFLLLAPLALFAGWTAWTLSPFYAAVVVAAWLAIGSLAAGSAMLTALLVRRIRNRVGRGGPAEETAGLAARRRPA